MGSFPWTKGVCPLPYRGSPSDPRLWEGGIFVDRIGFPKPWADELRDIVILPHKFLERPWDNARLRNKASQCSRSSPATAKAGDMFLVHDQCATPIESALCLIHRDVSKSCARIHGPAYRFAHYRPVTHLLFLQDRFPTGSLFPLSVLMRSARRAECPADHPTFSTACAPLHIERPTEFSTSQTLFLGHCQANTLIQA